MILGYFSQNDTPTRAEAVEKIENAPEVEVEKKEKDQKEILKDSPFIDINKENIKEIMLNKESKFIYFYQGTKDKFNKEEFDKVTEHALKLKNGMGIAPYKLDIETDFETLSAYLKERNPKMSDSIDDQIKSNTFLLANQYDDIWFWELDLINYFYGELLEQIFNFYQGPLRLFSEEQLIMNQSGENDLHIICYVDNFNNAESIKKLKNFRKFHTKNTDRFFHLKYWTIDNKEMAEKLKINTDPERIGDVYMLRQTSEFNQKKKNTKVCGYDFESKKLLSSEDIQKDVAQSFANIVSVVFNNPVIIHDYMSFALLTQKFKTNVFVVYCDQEDKETYEQIKNTLIKARYRLPINIKPNPESGELQKQQRSQDVIFVLSSVKNLMPLAKLKENGPQGLFICAEENFVNLLSNHLSGLQKIEGISQDAFITKALNNEKEFAYTAEDDDDTKRNKKDTLKMIYSPDRFIMPKMYYTKDQEVLNDPEQLSQFVQRSILGEHRLYWEGEKLPKERYSQKVVGEDFEKRILESKQDALVLIYHPIKEKNRQILKDFEHFAFVDGKKNKNLITARYNGINESGSFKSPQTLPQIYYFKGQEGQEEKQISKLEGIEEYMLKDQDHEALTNRLRELIKAHN